MAADPASDTVGFVPICDVPGSLEFLVNADFPGKRPAERVFDLDEFAAGLFDDLAGCSPGCRALPFTANELS